MATAPSAAPAPQPAAPAPKNELVIISHSTLFYWWPVWAIGFLMAAITAFSGQRMATVPVGTVAEAQRTVSWKDNEPRDVLVLPSKTSLPHDPNGEVEQPHLRVAASKTPGVLFCI